MAALPPITTLTKTTTQGRVIGQRRAANRMAACVTRACLHECQHLSMPRACTFVPRTMACQGRPFVARPRVHRDWREAPIVVFLLSDRVEFRRMATFAGQFYCHRRASEGSGAVGGDGRLPLQAPAGGELRHRRILEQQMMRVRRRAAAGTNHRNARCEVAFPACPLEVHRPLAGQMPCADGAVAIGVIVDGGFELVRARDASRYGEDSDARQYCGQASRTTSERRMGTCLLVCGCRASCPSSWGLVVVHRWL